jgi:hypothetical protein
MKGPKFQHWVPCSYLKQFAINGDIKGRHSRVMVTDQNGSRDAKVTKVGGANWTYSSLRPEVDHEFNEMENDLPRLVERLASGDHLNSREWLSLFLIMTDLHHRSVAYENKTSLERFEAYQIISRQWFAEILPSHVEKDDLQAYCNFIHENWRINLLTSMNGKKFITSDHPTIIFSDIVDQKPIAVLTPLDPQRYAIAFDATRLALLREGLSDHEVGLLNGLQVRRCIKGSLLRSRPLGQ